jgi:hypothetical protein
MHANKPLKHSNPASSERIGMTYEEWRETVVMEMRFDSNTLSIPVILSFKDHEPTFTFHERFNEGWESAARSVVAFWVRRVYLKGGQDSSGRTDNDQDIL